MLALLIEDVTLLKQRRVTAAVRFHGGATTTLTLPRPLTAQQIRATHEDVRQEIDGMKDIPSGSMCWPAPGAGVICV